MVHFGFKRIVRIMFLRIQIMSIWPSSIRKRLLRYGGVKIGKDSYIGGGNLFDTVRPELICIGERTTISTRCIILSHFVHQYIDRRKWSYGEVKIGNNVFLGANVIICQPITIGDNSAVAAGAVVTKDIPAGEMWGGVPAHFIKKVE